MPNIFDAFYFLLFFLQRKMRAIYPTLPYMCGNQCFYSFVTIY